MERTYNLTVTVKVAINGDNRQLAIDHLAQMICNEGLAGIEMAAMEQPAVTIGGLGYNLALPMTLR